MILVVALTKPLSGIKPICSSDDNSNNSNIQTSPVFEECNRISKFLIFGEGEWQGGAINCTTSELFIDSRITSLKGTLMKPSHVYSYATTPPICDENTFTNYSGTLHVPATSLAAYFTADYWSNFANIVGDAICEEK